MDKIERLNLADECSLAAWDLMAISQILRQVDQEDQPELLYEGLSIRSRRTARALMEIGADLTRAKEEAHDSNAS